jgi:hypothetical protein
MFQRRWLIADEKTYSTCGVCGCGFRKDDAFQQLTIDIGVYKYHCPDHALGGPDLAAGEQARADVKSKAEREKAEQEAPVAVGTPQRALPLDRPRGFRSLADYIDKRLPTGDRE